MNTKIPRILVVGGYGEVGRHVVSILLDQGYTVIVAGRSETKAQALFSALGQPLALSFRSLDLHAKPETFASVLADVETVVMCVEQTNTRFAALCLQQGLKYIDISASDDFLQALEALHNEAFKHSGSAVLSVGLAPGLSNLLAAQLLQTAALERLDIGVLLGTGDSHGIQALQWTFANLFKQAFNRQRHMHYAPPWGQRTLYNFNFSDQYSLQRTYNLPQVTTYLGFSSRLLTRALFMLRASWLKPFQPRLQSLLTFLNQFSLGSQTGYAIRVEGFKSNSLRADMANGLSGHQEALVTAAATAAVVVYHHHKPLPAGVHHIHQVLQLTDIWAIVQRYSDCQLSKPLQPEITLQI